MRKQIDAADRVKLDVTHALGYFRRQQEAHQNERDAFKARVTRLEEEVSTLQRRIQGLEADKKALAADKATLAEANRKVQQQISSMFNFGQSVQSGLAFQGLAANATA